MDNDFWKWYDDWKKKFYSAEDQSIDEFALMMDLLGELDDIRTDGNFGN